MRLHIIFQGGPADGLLETVTITSYDGGAPPEVYVAQDPGGEFGEVLKVLGHVYKRIEDVEPLPIPGHMRAAYQYSHDYRDLPITLVTALI